MDPIKLQQIINKNPRDIITAEEWNEILQLLVFQANELSDRLIAINHTIEGILNGDVPGITIDTNVTSFGGYTVDKFALKTDMTTAITDNNVNLTNLINSKWTKPVLTANKIVLTDAGGNLMTSDISHTPLRYLEGLTVNIQNEFKQKVWGASRVDQHLYVQQAQPSNPASGALWVSWA